MTEPFGTEFPATGSVPRPVVILTGLSGAGLSTALKALEDLGYEAVDNLPVPLLTALVEQGALLARPLAVVVDSRSRNFTAESLLERKRELAERPDLEVRLVFCDCADEVLLRRFTETRRRHPLAIDRRVSDGIARERAQLAPLREQADQLLDTSLLSLHEFRRLMTGQFQLSAEPGVRIFVTSFSFRQGLPREADLVFDVRFLDNPHYDPVLRPMTGLDAPVGARIEADSDFKEFFRNLTGLLQPLLPRYNQEGKSYLTIAVGCTGGRHRSVFVSSRLAEWLAGQGYRVSLAHRELDRMSTGTGP